MSGGHGAANTATAWESPDTSSEWIIPSVMISSARLGRIGRSGRERMSTVPEVVVGPADLEVAGCAVLRDPARLRALAEAGLTAEPDPRMETIAKRVRRRLG